MAQLEITYSGGGSPVTYLDILDAAVEIFHGDPDSPGEMKLVPAVQFVLKLSLNDKPELSTWALAFGEKRFAQAKLSLYNREQNFSRVWTIPKAYIHRYHEIEYPAAAHNVTSQENCFELVVRGVLPYDKPYDGKILVEMKPGVGVPNKDASNGASSPS